MKLHDIVTGPWAISPGMFSEIQGIYARHLRGEKIDLKSIEAKIGGPLPGPTKGYEVVGNVAVVPVDGVLAKRMNLMTQISGGTSMQILADDISEAINDPAVTTVILRIDSPGGTVDGTQELCDAIFEARGEKPIIALADGMMASAAYWIGSAADSVYVSSDTSQVGSIGVVAQHTDVSAAQANSGVKTTEITAGKYKRIASQYAPLTPEGRQSIQDQVDYTYSVFVNDVARNRGVDPETVIEKMADGRVFLGQQAVNAGLADGVSTLAELIIKASQGDFASASSNSASNAGAGAHQDSKTQTIDAESDGDSRAAESDATTPLEVMTMDVQKLKAEFPAVAQALVEEGREAGATAERERIKAVEDQSMPGHEALIASLKFDGKTSGPEAAVKVLQAEKTKKSDRLAALRQDAASATVHHAAAPAPGEEDDEDEECDDMEDASATPDGGGKSKKKASAADWNRVALDAKKYMASELKEGRRVSAAEAVAHVSGKR